MKYLANAILWAALFAFVAAVTPARAEREHIPPMEPKRELPNMPPDNAGGREAHVIYSALIGGALEGASEGKRWWSGAGSLGGCFAVGLWKENQDYKRGQEGYKHGLFSRKDLMADAVGCTIGVFGVRGMRAYAERRDGKAAYTLGWVQEF